MGLEIASDTIVLSEMTMTIKEGKVVGDSYQITLAEVVWKADKPGKVPSKCKGTIAREGEHLLLHLFKHGSDSPCESMLTGDWRLWKKMTEFPEGLRGLFGRSSTYARPEGLLVGATAMVDIEGDMFQLNDGLAWEGNDEKFVILEASAGDTKCRGLITAEDDTLRGELSAIDDQGYCPNLGGKRWSVDETKLPKKPLTNGKVVIAVADGEATITGAGASPLVCKQKILRTEPRATTDRGRDNIPVLSGVVIALQPNEPQSGVEACGEAVAALDAANCKLQMGELCDETMVAQLLAGAKNVTPHCPTHIVLGDQETKGRRVALLPVRDPVNLGCFEMLEPFKPAP